MINRITRNMLMFLSPGKMKNSKNPTTFQVIKTSRGFCMTCLALKLYVVYPFFTKHSISKKIPPLEEVFNKGKDKNIAVLL